MLTKTNNGLVWWLGVQAGLSNMAAAASMGGVLPEKWASMFLWVVGGLNAFTAAYVAAREPIKTPVVTKQDVLKGS